ncbi:MAG: extracellular solute-binding protein, partial [candidate division Zixibacteria bacterium]|nr:extracellular solute-binding protein [candidate division Zixibacteria bacterium]
MNKNKAVGLWLAILLAISVVSFGSCTKKEAAIVFMVGGAPDELEYWGELIREFETGTGFDVRIIRQPTDSDQRRQGLVVALKSKQTDPDVFLMDVVWTGQFMASGWLEPLDSYISEDDFTIEPFFEAVIDLADRYDDTLYALPV